ncbi:MAG: hypothetical protein QUS35_07105 [bacterium]|nr:hypothetical protein [bacterium]
MKPRSRFSVLFRRRRAAGRSAGPDAFFRFAAAAGFAVLSAGAGVPPSGARDGIDPDTSSVAAVFGPGPSLREDSLSTRYQKGLNTDDWQTVLNVGRSFGRNTVWLSDVWSSSRLVVDPKNDKWKDRHELSFGASRPIFPFLRLQVVGESRGLSDKQSGYMNDLRTRQVSVGLDASAGVLSLPVSIGVMEDERFGRADRGLTAAAGLGLSRFGFSDYSGDGSVRFRSDDLGPRKNGDLGWTAGVSRTFEPGTADSLRVSVRSQRRDYYVSAAGDVESRAETAREAANVLTYRLSRRARCRLEGALRDRALTIRDRTGGRSIRERERNDFGASGSAELIWTGRSLRAETGYRTAQNDQDYWIARDRPGSPFSGLTDAPDNRSRLNTAWLRLAVRLSASDSVSFRSSLDRLRYDTPDEANADDRDELRFGSDLLVLHDFTGDLSLRTSLSFHSLHQVYIRARRSADNSRVRILRLNPELRWRPSPRFRASQSAEVLINTMAYDFEEPSTGIRSYLYRAFRLDDSVRVEVLARTGIFANVRLDLDENGKLLWKRWMEQRLADRQSFTGSVVLDHRPAEGWHLMPGWSVYRRKGWRFKPAAGAAGSGDAGRELNLHFRNDGPVLKVAYAGGRLAVSAFAGLTRTRNLGAKTQRLTRLELNMSWRP